MFYCKILINSGIKAIYYLEGYTGKDGLQLLEESGIQIQQIGRNN